MAEGILSQEDREFNSSVGNWAGGIYWESGPIVDKNGLMAVESLNGSSDKIITLTYPRLRIFPGIVLSWYHWDHLIPTDEGSILYYPRLKDGNYTIDYFLNVQIIGHPLYNRLTGYQVPSDWIKNQSQLEITVVNFYNRDGWYYWDNMSMLQDLPTKTDHLPLTGVH